MVLHQQYLNKKRAFAHQKKPSFSGNLRTNLIKSYCCVGILHKRTPRLTATRMFQFYPLWGSETFSESVTMTCVISVPQVCPRGGESGIPTGFDNCFPWVGNLTTLCGSGVGKIVRAHYAGLGTSERINGQRQFQQGIFFSFLEWMF